MLDPDFVLNATARARLIERFGAEAVDWCAALPELVEKYCARWQLELDHAVSGGTSRVFFGRQRGDRGDRGVVLKLTPDRSLAATEGLALRAWAASPHAPDLLAADIDDGVLLLERIEPGNKVGDQAEPASVTEIAGLLLSLRTTAPRTGLDQLPTLAERVDFLFALIRRRATHPHVMALVAPELADRGYQLAQRLAAGGGDSGLVHGDLHAGNVLIGGSARGLVAIDPRPCIGDRTFDVIDWALDRVTSVGQLVTRIERFGAVMPGLDGDVLRRWCGATAVISAVQRLFAGGPPTDSTSFLLELAGAALTPA